MSITVFTPTYNRAYCLINLYASLCNQTDKNFTWLIVDDGSTDNTREILQPLLEKDTGFHIVYLYKENGGKPSATELAIKYATDELFFCVDSDDIITDNAIETISNKNSQYKNEAILGFYFKKVAKDGTNLATNYPVGLKIVGITDLYHNYKFSGDTAIVLKTDCCRNVVWPRFKGEKFITERVFYNQINDIAPMILCDDCLLYTSEAETVSGLGSLVSIE